MGNIEELEARVEELEIWKEKAINYLQKADERIKALEELVVKPKKESTVKRWTDEEVTFLRNNYFTKSPSELANMWKKEFGYPRTVDSIRRKIQRTLKK